MLWLYEACAVACTHGALRKRAGMTPKIATHRHGVRLVHMYIRSRQEHSRAKGIT